jgi:hypothetical protein
MLLTILINYIMALHRKRCILSSVADPDPDVWDRIRIRILALVNDTISTSLVCVKAINTSSTSVV